MKHKLIIIGLLFFCISSIGQTKNAFYNSGNNSTTKKYVGASWLKGTIILSDGSELNGQVRGYSYKGNDINSFRYRSKKGDKAITIKADMCELISYDGLIILSLPKNLKKKSGKRRFYVALYHGEHLTIFQNPKAQVSESGYASASGNNAISFNEGQMLSFLVLKDGEFSKLTALNFRKQMKKITSDNKKFMERTKDKRWFKYDNIYKIAHFYNQTKN
ncbi:MAG: Uncharacterised protein [Flavobacterium sp. SCGC AAA160-P02]|nr:MAG: Uncharacterised protein [Flavobacterium sp. SCGC AAA160-P02]